MRDVGERFECGNCGQVFFGEKGKLDFLKHRTECSGEEECNDKVVITPVAHYDDIAVTYSCLVTVYHDDFKVIAFEMHSEGCAVSNQGAVIAFARKIINMIQKAKVEVRVEK